MKYKKINIIILIFLIISYIFWFYQLNFCTINTYLLKSIILAIPIVFILLIIVLLERGKIKAILATAVTIVLIVIYMILNFFIFTIVALEEGTSYENNPLRYKHIYNIAGYDTYKYQFPNKIPNDILDSNKVKFYILESKPYKGNNWNHGCVQYMAKNERLEKLLLVTQIW